MYRVGFYTIPYVRVHIGSWHTWTAGKQTISCTRVYVQDWCWIGYIFNSNPCNLISVNWFLWGYLNVFKISHQAEVVTYPCRNVTMVCGAFHHIFGSCIYLQDTKIWLNCKSNLTPGINDFSKSWHLVSYVFRHNAMAYDSSMTIATVKRMVAKQQQQQQRGQWWWQWGCVCVCVCLSSGYEGGVLLNMRWQALIPPPNDIPSIPCFPVVPPLWTPAMRVAGEYEGNGKSSKSDDNGDKEGNCMEEGNGKRQQQWVCGYRDNNNNHNNHNNNGIEYNNDDNDTDDDITEPKKGWYLTKLVNWKVWPERCCAKFKFTYSWIKRLLFKLDSNTWY